MNICIITQEYPPETNWGGIATYSQVLARQLAATGQRVHVVALAEGDEFTADDLGVVVHRVSRIPRTPFDPAAVPQLAGLSHGILYFSQRVWEKIQEIHRQEPLDVIEAPETCAQALLTFIHLEGVAKVTRLHTPFFWVRHLNNMPESREHLVRDQLEKLQTELSTAVTSPTHAMAEVVKNQWGTADIEVIPNFFNLKSYIPDLSVYEQHLNGLDYLLFFGRLEHRKGVQVLAQALPGVLEKYPELTAVFVGSDSILNAVSMKVTLQNALKGYEKRVLFIDNIPHQGLYPIIEHSRFVVLPSLWENFPYACIEAMALGKTVVTSRSGGFPEIIDDRVDGILCPPGDPDGLQKAISCCMEDEDTDEIGQRAREKVRIFDTLPIVDRMISFYQAQRVESPAHEVKIAYILLHVPYPSETFILNEMIALQELGLKIHPVSLFETTPCHEHLVEKLQEPIFDVSFISSPEATADENRFSAHALRIAAELAVPARLAPYAAAVAEFITSHDVNHLHAHFATEAALITLIVSRLTGVPFSFTAHAYDLFNVNSEATGGLSLPQRLSLLLPEAAGVVTISEFNKKYLLARIDKRYEQKLHIVRCGIDLERFQPEERSSRETVTFLSVGRFVEKKGHEYLLRAFKRAMEKADNLRLKLIGDGYLWEELHNLCAELNLTENVEFLGAVSSHIVNEEMKQADVFVLHSITAPSGDMEGIPVSIMEASATGLPVISTRHSGISELVVEEVTGLLSDEKDVETFADHMLKLAASPELRHGLGIQGRRLVAEKFNLGTENKGLRDIFRRLTSQPPVRLNIAFLTNMLSDPANGGGNVHVHQMAYGLLERGHRLYTNLLEESDLFVKWTEDEFRVNGKQIDVFYIRIHGHPGNDELTCYRKFNSEAPCLWEVNAPLEELLTCGTSQTEIASMNSRRRELAKLVTAAVCVSSEMKSYAERELGISSTYLIPNGSDPEVFSPQKCKERLYGPSLFTVLWSGSPDFPWQGLRVVEEVARKMREVDKEVTFAITAQGESHENLQYIGKVPYDQMPAFMASADAGLCIYQAIDFFPAFFFSPLKLYDYMASGIPVIGANLGQIAEVVDCYNCGILTDTSVDDIVEKILYLKNNPEESGRLGANGRKAVVQHRTWKHVVMKTEHAMLAQRNRNYGTDTTDASVVICTYNRSDLLKESILALVDQDFPFDRYEVIVVDNNSSDDTRAVTEELAASSPVPIRYVFESNQGLSFARNAGIAQAHGEIVAFVDDDIDAESNWLSAIVAVFQDANVMCAGGPIRPIWPGQKPCWLGADWEPYLTINEFDAARKAGEYTWPDTPWGANISFRKKVFDTVGLFPTNLGRVGNSLLSNEEVNICKKIAQTGLRIAFAPDAVIHHKIAPERVTKQWFYHRTYWQGRSDAILDLHSGMKLHYGMRERLRLYVTAAGHGTGNDFAAACFKRIVQGYLYQAVFSENRGARKNDLRVFRTLIRYIEDQRALPASALPSKTTTGGTPDTTVLAGRGILVVDYEVPQFDKYAGSRTTFLYLKLLAELGLKVYFLPDDFERREPYTTALEELGIEVLHGAWLRDNWRQWIRGHADKFHYVFFNRPNITVNYLDFVREHTRSVILFQGHDLHYLRLSRKYEVDGDPETLREAEEYKKIEFDIMEKSDIIVSYSEYERNIIASHLPNKPVHAIPLFFYDRFHEEPIDFAHRRDIMFVGGCGHHPNHDAILWFAQEIFPRVLEIIPDMVFHIIGPHPPADILELDSPNIRVCGHLSDSELEERYRRIRMIVVPLRFGAGVKGKTVEAIYKGIPIVSTSIGLEGIAGIDSIIRPADTEQAFADELVSLYRDDLGLALASSLYRSYATANLHASGAKSTLASVLQAVPVPEISLHPARSAQAETAPRLIAMYLPQFHPIPENDSWWGKGFTEWRNVAKAQPSFPGHYQPHLPADLGFYDLRLEETRIAQTELARAYGIHGFCYYHYWFNGKRLLERPLEEMLKSGEPDFPFCVCWANENWTRRWDGEDQHVLIKQEYSEEDDRLHIRDLFRVFEDHRYIRIDGKPVFLVYRTENIPDPLRTTQIWREEALEAGIGELYLVRVEGIGETDPRAIGFDAAMEFAPDWQRKGPRIKENPSGQGTTPAVAKVYEQNYVHNYDDLVNGMLEKPTPEYKRFRCVTPSWDNSARRREGANIFVGSTPQKYQHWLESTIGETKRRLKGEEAIVFINAWNEWAEGNHLEPDQLNGRAYLEATRNALNGLGKEQREYEEALRLLKEKQAKNEWLISEYEKSLAEFQQQSAEKDRIIAEQEQQLSASLRRIEDLLRSASWRLTAPLRWSLDQVLKLKSK